MAAASTALDQLRRRWLARRLAMVGRRIRLTYRRIFILPSRAGLVFAVLLFGIWLGAVNYNNNMAFLLCFLLIGLGISAKIHTFRNLLGLEVGLDDAPAVFAGETAHFPLRLINHDQRERSGLEILQKTGDGQSHDVPAGAETLATLAVRTSRRGTERAPEFRIRTRFPTGLVSAWSWLSLDASVVVYPAPETGHSEPPPVSGGRRGGRATGDGNDDFHGLRRYQPGDSLRQVAWHALARGQELQTKQFTGLASGSVWLAWDDTAGLPTEQRLARLCRWVLDAESSGLRYGLVLPGRRLHPHHGIAHRNRCLTSLALLQP